MGWGTRPKIWAMRGIALAAIGLLVGCGRQIEQSARPGAIPRAQTVSLPTPAPTPSPSPVQTRVMPLELTTPTATSAVTPTNTPIPDEARGLVVEVIDGDTIAVLLEGDTLGRTYEVRYLGIDAPPNSPGNPWGVVAYETNRKLTNLKVVRLARDVTDADNEGRLLRYVYVGDRLINTMLVDLGLARANVNTPDVRLRADIEAAEARARKAKRGVWGPSPTPTPTPGGRETTPTPTGTAGALTRTPTTASQPATTASPEITPPAATPTRTIAATPPGTPSSPPETPEAGSQLQGPE